MTCPNCGAELLQHTFADVCHYCGYMSVKNTFDSSNSKQACEALKYYEYIKENIQYLKFHPEFVSAKQFGTSYEIQCSKAFHPLDKQYQLCYDIDCKWKVIIDKDNFQLSLLSKGMKSVTGRVIVTLDKILHLTLQELQENVDFDEYLVPYMDFEAICNSSTITFALNENYRYDEFRAYSHRFYNLVFNRTKYVYAINQHLLTD